MRVPAVQQRPPTFAIDACQRTEAVSLHAQIDGGLPLRLDGSVRYSPYLPEADGADKTSGTNTATVVAIEDEAEGIKTFTLAVPTGLDHLPGQFASFDIEARGDPQNGTYATLS
jgi:hypothetical protein